MSVGRPNDVQSTFVTEEEYRANRERIAQTRAALDEYESMNEAARMAYEKQQELFRKINEGKEAERQLLALSGGASSQAAPTARPLQPPPSWSSGSQWSGHTASMATVPQWHPYGAAATHNGQQTGTINTTPQPYHHQQVPRNQSSYPPQRQPTQSRHYKVRPGQQVSQINPVQPNVRFNQGTAKQAPAAERRQALSMQPVAQPIHQQQNAQGQLMPKPQVTSITPNTTTSHLQRHAVSAVSNTVEAQPWQYEIPLTTESSLAGALDASKTASKSSTLGSIKSIESTSPTTTKLTNIASRLQGQVAEQGQTSQNSHIAADVAGVAQTASVKSRISIATPDLSTNAFKPEVRSRLMEIYNRWSPTAPLGSHMSIPNSTLRLYKDNNSRVFLVYPTSTPGNLAYIPIQTFFPVSTKAEGPSELPEKGRSDKSKSQSLEKHLITEHGQGNAFNHPLHSVSQPKALTNDSAVPTSGKPTSVWPPIVSISAQSTSSGPPTLSEPSATPLRTPAQADKKSLARDILRALNSSSLKRTQSGDSPLAPSPKKHASDKTTGTFHAQTSTSAAAQQPAQTSRASAYTAHTQTSASVTALQPAEVPDPPANQTPDTQLSTPDTTPQPLAISRSPATSTRLTQLSDPVTALQSTKALGISTPPEYIHPCVPAAPEISIGQHDPAPTRFVDAPPSVSPQPPMTLVLTNTEQEGKITDTSIASSSLSLSPPQTSETTSRAEDSAPLVPLSTMPLQDTTTTSSPVQADKFQKIPPILVNHSHDSSSTGLVKASLETSQLGNILSSPALPPTPLFLPSPTSTPPLKRDIIDVPSNQLDAIRRTNRWFGRAPSCYILVPHPPSYVLKYKAQRARDRRRPSSSPIGTFKVDDVEIKSVASSDHAGEDVEVYDIDPGNAISVNGEEEAVAVRLSCSRLSPQICKWKECNIVLNSTERLIRHLVITHVRHGASYAGLSFCMWQQCGMHKENSADLFLHLKNHALSHLQCAYEDCQETFRTPRQLARHQYQHGDNVLKRGAMLSVSSFEPLPNIPTGDFSTYLMDLVKPTPISKEKHAALGPRVLRQIAGPVNLEGKHSKLWRSTTSHTQAQATRQTYDFLIFPSTNYSTAASQPSTVRNMDDLDSIPVSNLMNQDRLVFFEDTDPAMEEIDESIPTPTPGVGEVLQTMFEVDSADEEIVERVLTMS